MSAVLPEEDLMRNLLLPSLFALALCGGCAGTSDTRQSVACPPSVVASAAAPVSCGPHGWPDGGVVTNRNGDGPHVDLWGPPTTFPTGRD
jgi:hypothetical protein